jgi:predicted DNA-binding transcriptional regulator AlpA
MTAHPGVTGRKAVSANLADDPVLSEPETAKYIGISLWTLMRMRKRGEIPYIQISDNRVGYRRSMANEIIDARTVRPTLEAAE